MHYVKEQYFDALSGFLRLEKVEVSRGFISYSPPDFLLVTPNPTGHVSLIVKHNLQHKLKLYIYLSELFPFINSNNKE